MSQTVPVDVVSRSYWAYVASAMADGLGGMLERGEKPSVVPRRVYSDAKEFFRLALEAAGDTVPQNPSASIANYIIAADAVRAVQHNQTDRTALRKCLEGYQQLVERLECSDAFKPEEAAVANELKDFFLELEQEAEAETYDRIVQFESPKSGLRLV
jgi:hypothetical protein